MLGVIGIALSGTTPATKVTGATVPSARAMAASQSDGVLALDPTIYHHVAQITWVVGDLDRVVNYWQQLGIKDVHKEGNVTYSHLSYRGKPDRATAKQATAIVAGLQIKWIQPLTGGTFWQEELHKKGDGIRALSYSVNSSQEFDDQIHYFASKGVGVVVEDVWKSSAGPARMAYLDTAEKGGGTMIGLLDDPEARTDALSAAIAANEYPLQKITHFAWVVPDVRSVDAFYTSLGFRPLSSIDHNISLDRIYRGQPGNYEMWLGWNRTGDAPFEWVQQITGQDIYRKRVVLAVLWGCQS
jgi:hypothetical protein